MGSVKRETATEGKSGAPVPEKSVYFSNERLDRKGQVWEKQAFWFRKEYLGKLKVIAHFEGKKPQELIDRAVGEYITREFDKSQALQKLVAQSTDKRQKVSS